VANIQVSAERKNTILEAHRRWLSELPRAPGQIGGTIGTLVEGPPIYTPGEVTTYSDFEPVCFYRVDPGFIQFLKDHDVHFDEKQARPLVRDIDKLRLTRATDVLPS